MRKRNKLKNIFRSWRWESEYTPDSSTGHIRIKSGLVWSMPGQLGLADFLMNRHQFAVAIRATMMTPDGDSWGLSSLLYPEGVLMINEFEDVYQEQRIALLEGVKTEHIVDVGWVIQTYTDGTKNFVMGDKWWQVANCKATVERQQLWRYYHNIRKQELRDENK